ncbi:hypothetical protein GVX82_00385 [Patescibacteria group bacterium]|nr:hypothetical protein [Patescibacteria group bacterium]
MVYTIDQGPYLVQYTDQQVSIINIEFQYDTSQIIPWQPHFFERFRDSGSLFITDWDINFDGYPDLGVFDSTGYMGVNMFYRFYVYDPESGWLQPVPILDDAYDTLSNPRFDKDTQTIRTSMKSGLEWEDSVLSYADPGYRLLARYRTRVLDEHDHISYRDELNGLGLEYPRGWYVSVDGEWTVISRDDPDVHDPFTLHPSVRFRVCQSTDTECVSYMHTVMTHPNAEPSTFAGVSGFARDYAGAENARDIVVAKAGRYYHFSLRLSDDYTYLSPEIAPLLESVSFFEPERIVETYEISAERNVQQLTLTSDRDAYTTAYAFVARDDGAACVGEATFVFTQREAEEYRFQATRGSCDIGVTPEGDRVRVREIGSCDLRGATCTFAGTYEPKGD